MAQDISKGHGMTPAIAAPPKRKGPTVSSDVMIRSMVRDLSGISAVRKIYCAHEGDAIHVWTASSSFAREVRDRIYAVELDIMKCFPDQAFDFHVTDANDETEYSDVKLIYSA